MISKPTGGRKRPGLCIPVFFLSLTLLHAQDSWGPAHSLALGGCTSHPHRQAPFGNPAPGLLREAGTRQFHLHHSFPTRVPELSLVSLAATFPWGTGRLSPGVGSRGLPGMRQTFLTVSYGMPLGESSSAGLRLTTRVTRLPGDWLHHPALGFDLGYRQVLTHRWALAFLLEERREQAPEVPEGRLWRTTLTAGFSFEFFERFLFVTDVRATSGQVLESRHGLEIDAGKAATLCLGFHTHPPGLSGGIRLTAGTWNLVCGTHSLARSGLQSALSLDHGW
ncbi:MAG: hypothetical protein R2751_13950 [Bacteroidales bacterium]